MSEGTHKPDFDVSIKLDGKWHRIGAAWNNSSGSINITTNACVVLPSGPTKLSLFPANYVPKAQQTSVPPARPARPKPGAAERVRETVRDPEDDIPFEPTEIKRFDINPFVL